MYGVKFYNCFSLFSCVDASPVPNDPLMWRMTVTGPASSPSDALQVKQSSPFGSSTHTYAF